MELLPDELVEQLRKYQDIFGEGKSNAALRRSEDPAVEAALSVIAAPEADPLERRSYAEIFGELDRPECVPVLIKIAEDIKQPVAIRLACFKSLAHYDDPTIGQNLSDAYAYHIRSDPDVRAAAFRLFASRPEWTLDFLQLVYKKQSVKRDEVPLEIVREFKLAGDAEINRIVDEVWPEVTNEMYHTHGI